jgi:FAD/FMN-containing dehydrogenase
MRWQNWSGRNKADLQQLAFVRSEEDARALVQQCAATGQTLRVAGAGHSHSPVVVTDQVIADISGLSGVLDVDEMSQQAWVRAGSPIYSLGVQLHEHGLALRNQGDIDRQLLGGVIATGTHGTGRNLQNISASVTGLQVVLASGDVIECDANSEPGLFQAARLSIGSVGLITRIRMQLTSSSVIREAGWTAGFEELLPQVPDLIKTHERFEFFWYPGSDEATVKVIDPAGDGPVYPLAEEGARQAYSYEVLPSHRPHLHTEMEYSVPAENGISCLREIRQLLRDDFPDVVWPVEYRTVAADDIWLSMASGRPTVTISVHQDIREDEELYYRACEEIFLDHEGRPHWGKVHYIGGEEFSSCYPDWSRWWHQRNHYDPQGIFLNPWAARLNPESQN